jgi:hypothetical protein
VDKEWWTINKTETNIVTRIRDFVNLQESENYAFGHDFETAIRNYRSLMPRSISLTKGYHKAYIQVAFRL